ncbi:aminotransferase class V-fold PLP-dependent enzyme [Rhizobium paknamense]|uniref:Glycine hydroxymethyltransferase n=1 Tax=Rhizobium paknamense TaxID=1206817 RepID=A0ABU0I9S4_9HYPH|nr:aminotransferase class V-fold PLP-dependent enzyme [Rhizobium paknamense]MDQ0454983.1 glycine hydroxymethyltransferase [Rhizobium paknamense]
MSDIEELIQKHTETRSGAINLIVSENRMSEKALAALSSDLASRYAAPFYAGTDYSQQIMSLTEEKARRVFEADYVNISPISGSASLMAVVFALTSPGDKVGRVPPFFPGGGYPFQYEVFDRVSLPLPFSDEEWQLDLEATLELLEREKPKLVILGASIFTFPMPLQEVADLVHSYGGIVAYDGSHSLGLIVGKQYQDPLREGADILFGSTHKTFPGPQGGMIATNNKELHERIELVSNFTPLNGPTMICNPHLARIASLGIVLDEVPWERYAEQVVKNSRAFARTLNDAGFEMRGQSTKRFSEFSYCHQVLPKIDKQIAMGHRDKLKHHNIHVDGFMRVGTAEITRLGYDEDDCTRISEIMLEVISSNMDVIPSLKNEVIAMNAAKSRIVM